MSTLSISDEEIREAESALEIKKSEYWIQYGVVIALKRLKEIESQPKQEGEE